MNVLRAGSRESRLAVIQSEIILNEIHKKFPDIKTELVTFKTTGDKKLDISLDTIGGKGLFVKELDMALLSRKADITIHSLKDMPIETNENLPIIIYSKRANPFDALVLPFGKEKIDFNKPVGCSSRRRSIQFKEIYPQAYIKPIRGNVLTRLEKLDREEYSALILAAAGLERLGLSSRISRLFSPEEILPSAGQGIIAVQCLKHGGYEFLKVISSRESEICAAAERACIKSLNGGCTSPAAAFCTVAEGKLHLRGFNVCEGKIIRAEIFADINEGEKAGILLAERLVK